MYSLPPQREAFGRSNAGGKLLQTCQSPLARLPTCFCPRMSAFEQQKTADVLHSQQRDTGLMTKRWKDMLVNAGLTTGTKRWRNKTDMNLVFTASRVCCNASCMSFCSFGATSSLGNATRFVTILVAHPTRHMPKRANINQALICRSGGVFLVKVFQRTKEHSLHDQPTEVINMDSFKVVLASSLHHFTLLPQD